MNHFCPAYPAPRKTRTGIWKFFFSARRSWLDSLYERSYRMQMGEVHLPGLAERLQGTGGDGLGRACAPRTIHPYAPRVRNPEASQGRAPGPAGFRRKRLA